MEQQPQKQWKILEFYSGIGGLRYSVEKSGISGSVLEAFDINDKANDVYEFNFGHRPFQGNIQTLTYGDLDNYQADAWLLSPPCQPYTRQGLQKQSADARASSFLKILDLIPHMSRPPLMLFVENVVGFETSDTHGMMVEVLKKSGFVTQEFVLSPIQFGIPYSRPRYFCLAKREPVSFQNPLFNNQLLWTPTVSMTQEDSKLYPNTRCEESQISRQPISNFLEIPCSSALKDQGSLGDCCVTNVSQFAVPRSLIERWGNVMDIVYPESTCCCCFTKSYNRYVKGTGSFLATVQPDKKSEALPLNDLGLRYFTPREVANLHCFPKDFQFPQHISLRQQYALLGNSVSVAVVAPLLQYLFFESYSP
ncbi:hypothetical protein QJS10_CPB22g01084 [Acorus calamus]|uniref:tRNA (Cytosine(38)-C(5))-methyltransferase n=1 Tax=Acorus calamus TaxID=4465 RepID=A0AAV9C1Z7_ACOCL|nr:hypothetical protein QJS10_CPB22g01084 [Acorus calamus]